MEALGKRLAAPLKDSEWVVTPIDCSLNIAENAAQIKEWAQGSATLPPFKDWFCYFQEVNTCDGTYFNPKRNELGNLVNKTVNSIFQTFRQNPSNAGFNFDVKFDETLGKIRGQISFSGASPSK